MPNINVTIRALNAATGLHADARALEDLLGLDGYVNDNGVAADEVARLLGSMRAELRKLAAWAGKPAAAKGAAKIADDLEILLGSSDEDYVAVRKKDAKRWIAALRAMPS